MSVSENQENNPLVSVCIPVYNSERHIRQAIESVLSQTYSNFELIISDNASTDKTIEIVESFEDARITVSKNEANLGMIGNFSACIKKAQGKYVKILCSDDALLPTALEKEVDAFENNETASVVTGASLVVNYQNKVLLKRKFYKKDKLIDGLKFAKKTIMNARNHYGEPSVLMLRTQQAAASDIFTDDSTFFCIDWDTGITMSYWGDVYYLAEPVAVFKISNESTSVKMKKNKDDRIYTSSVALFQKHKNIGKLGLTNFDFVVYKIKTKINMWGRFLIQEIGKG